MTLARLGCPGFVVLSFCLCVAGCHRRAPLPAPPLAPTATIPLAQTPEPDKPVLVQTVPLPPAPLPTKPVQPARLKKVRKKPVDQAPATVVASAATPPSNQVASAGIPAGESVIGSLTAGGESAPALKQKAADEISSVEKRLGGLSQSTVDGQKEGLTRVRSFLRQAHEALYSGDADGASTLATKAGVLLDDLLK